MKRMRDVVSGAVLVIDEVNVKFGSTRVLRGASLTVSAEERVAVVGPSGSGKSTVLYVAVGLIRPQAGSVMFDGTDLGGLSDRELSAWRRSQVGFVFQFGHLIAELSIIENIQMPVMINGGSRSTARERATELIDQFGLGHIAARFPDQVSGGELQRVAVARATAARPRLIVADEPTGALDSKAGGQVLGLLADVTGPDTGAALIMVTHDPEVAARADRVVRVRDGRTTSAAAAVPA